MKNIIYLNEDTINEELIEQYGGEVKETVEKINNSIGVGGEVGGEAGDPSGLLARLKGAISANYEKGREEQFVYDMTDEVAKFALLMETLDTSNAIEVNSGFDIDDRNNLSTDSPILITAPLLRIPIGEIKEKFDKEDVLDGFSKGFSEIAKSGWLTSEEMDKLDDLQEEIESAGHATSGMRKILNSIADDDLYRTNTPSDVDFVMELNEQHFRYRPIDFPSATKSYAIIGKVATKIEQGNNVPLIPLAEFAERNVDNPRERKVEEKNIQGRITEMANETVERDVSISEFELSYPDVQIKPLAIY